MGRVCGFVGSALLASLVLLAGVGSARSAPARSAAGITETCNSQNCPITINDNASAQDEAASPYPSQIHQGVADPAPAIDKVTVTLAGLSHAALDDVDVLLVSGTGGGAVELMSDAGGRALPTTAVDLTFDDSASASLPDELRPTSGTYKPTNYPGTIVPCVPDSPLQSATGDPFPAPAPAPPTGGYSQTLETFHGLGFGGSWRLYVGDDCVGGSGSITSWTLNMTFIPCGYLCVFKKADAVTVTAGSPIGFTLDAGNRHYGEPECEVVPEECAIHGVTLSDPLPAGIGMNWSISPAYTGPGSCSINGAIGSQTLSCSFGDFLYVPFGGGGGARVHVSSPTTIGLGCRNYPNTATVTGTDQFGPLTGQDTTSVTVTGCPTSVSLTSIAATPSKRGVLVRWRTASEAGLLGFNVFRKRAGKLARVNSRLIPSVFRGAASGHAYSWLDRTAPRKNASVEYRLQAVGVDGSRRWLGASVVSY